MDNVKLAINQYEEESEVSEDSLPEIELSLSVRIGALLFSSIKPLSAQQLAELTQSDIDQVEEALESLVSKFAKEEIGFSLCEVAGAWQFRTSPETASTVHKLISPKAKKLSRAAAETLAIIAYKQPVQRAEIEAIRGVDALPTLRTLLDFKLIQIIGREDSVGQPALYGTSKQFLEKFGMRDLSELPSTRELQELAEEDSSESSVPIEETL